MLRDLQPADVINADAARRARVAVTAGVVIYLTVMIVAVVAVDALNLLGSRDALEASAIDRPAVWFYANAEGHLTEMLQWSALAALALVSATTAANLRTVGAVAPARFWATFAVLAVLLLVEDAGNPRHTIARFALMLTDDILHRFLSELLVFMLLGAVALYAVVIHGAVLRRAPQTLRYLAAGVVIYAAAGTTSVLRLAGDWYAALGERLRKSLGFLVVFGDNEDLSDPINYSDRVLVDLLVEEPVELVAATLLLLAALRYREEVADYPDRARVTDGLWARGSLLRQRHQR